MNKFLVLLGLMLLSTVVFSQNTGIVKGKLVDSTGKQSMKDATVSILDARDSAVDVITLSKQDGSFTLNNVTYGNLLFQVKFQGYETFSKLITLSDSNKVFDLGIINMKLAATDLGNVTVTQSVMSMKKDTLEINASAFKTKPNAVAEDLLKKVPGLEVGKDGSVKAQGEQVQRILVDGKRFFGDDPKMATKNLPPDVIDKIQVFDDLSDQSKFTGFDDGNRVKTINITTKKNARTGYFGKAVLGAGTDGNYDESFNIHKFKGSEQISILGQGNDINKQNFTQQDILGGGGGNRGFGNNGGGNAGSSPSGITTTWAAGINYRDAWSKNVDAYGSYFYNNLRTDIEQKSLTRNILSNAIDSSTYNDRTSASLSRTPNHRINFNIEDRLDSNNSFIFRPNVTIQSSMPVSSSSTSTTGGNDTKRTPIYQTTNSAYSSNRGFSINGANFQLRHKFAKKFRTISLDLNLSANQNDGDGYNYSVNNFYQPVVKTDTINQRYVDTLHSITFTPTLSYTEPIGNNQILEFRYSYVYNKSTSVNNTYRFNNAAHDFTTFDSLFSNSYKYVSTSSNANISYRIQRSKFNMSVGTGLQFTDLTSNNTTKNVTVARNYVNFTPSVNFTYNYSRSKSLRIFYNGRTGQPSTAQLQPVTTTSDSINFQIGNPNLKPQFTHSLRVLYTSFDPFTSRVIFATINASTIVNDIQTSVTNPAIGSLTNKTTTTYVNLNGTYNVQGYFNYGFPIKSPKSNMNLQTNVNYSQYQSLVDQLSNYTRSTTISETIKWTTNLKNNFDMNLSAAYAYNPISNSLTPSRNSNYTTATLAADFTVYSNNGWILASDFDYTHYGNRAPGFNTTVLLVTPSIAKQFLKNKAGEIRLSCFDLLNQNAYVSSTQSNTQDINTKTNTLKRYLMLTFTYNLRSFAGQQQGQQRGNNNNMMRGMMRNFDGGGGNGNMNRRGGGNE